MHLHSGGQHLADLWILRSGNQRRLPLPTIPGIFQPVFSLKMTPKGVVNPNIDCILIPSTAILQTFFWDYITHFKGPNPSNIFHVTKSQGGPRPVSLRVLFRGPWAVGENRWRFLGFKLSFQPPKWLSRSIYSAPQNMRIFRSYISLGEREWISSACQRERMILIYIKYFRLFSRDFFGFFHMICMIWLSWFSLWNMMKCIEMPKTSSIRLCRWRPWNPSLAWVFWRCLSGEVPAWSISPTKQVVSVVHIDILQFGAYTKHVWLTLKERIFWQ